MVENKWSFLFSWILHNLIGGLVGGIFGFLLVVIISDVLSIYFDFFLMPFWLPAFLFFVLFGLVIGLAQKIKMKEVGIQVEKWEIATTIGWFIASLIFLIGFDFLEGQGLSRTSLLFYSTLLVLFGALFISALQASRIKGEIQPKHLWFFANIISALLLEFVALNLFFLLDDFPRNLEVSKMLIYLLLTCFLPIPTGTVLLNLLARQPKK